MASVRLRSARTTLTDPEAAAESLVNELGLARPKLVTLFAAYELDHLGLNRAVRARLPKETRLIGASGLGEIDNQGIHHGSVVLAALEGDLEVGLGLGQGLSTDALSAGNQAIAQACRQLGVRQADLDPREHVGLVIDDGVRQKKEELLLGILEKNQSLVLVGGGAAVPDMGPTARTGWVHVDGEVATDAALVALIRTKAPWAAMRSHWFEPSGKTLRITRAEGQRALEIDGKPAAERYAELLGVSIPDLAFGKPTGFSSFPTALRVGREYFIRGPYMVLPDGSILFTNLLEDDIELDIMKPGDPVALTRRFLEVDIQRRVPNPQAVLLFQCGARMWVAASEGFQPQLSDCFKSAPPCAGFNVYFEIYCGFQINTTLTSLAFGATS